MEEQARLDREKRESGTEDEEDAIAGCFGRCIEGCCGGGDAADGERGFAFKLRDVWTHPVASKELGEWCCWP